ncbi:MAG: ISAs1 family transposase, partial [Sphingobacteriales bacterium]
PHNLAPHNLAPHNLAPHNLAPHNLAPHNQELASIIRGHWSIENQAHWMLDVVLGEDRCRTGRDHAPYNLALLRCICLNLLRQNQGKNCSKPHAKR